MPVVIHLVIYMILIEYSSISKLVSSSFSREITENNNISTTTPAYTFGNRFDQTNVDDQIKCDGNIACASITVNYLIIIKSDTINFPECTWVKTVKIRFDSILLPGTEAHDLFPVYNEEVLWLT